MTTENVTLNDGAAGAAAVSSTASGNFDSMIPTMPEDNPAPPSAETLNTVEGEQGKQEAGQAAEAEGKQTGAEKETPPVATKEPEPEPFHKHPRFQELISKNKSLETTLTEVRQQMELLVKNSNPAADEKQFDREFAKIEEQLENGDITVAQAMKMRDGIQDRKYQASLQSMLQEKLTEQAKQTQAQAIQQKFLSDNPDFEQVKESGELQRLMDANPMHDHVSAYYEYKARQNESQIEKAVTEAVAKATKETEERLRKEFTAKRNAASLSGSPAHVPRAGEDPRLTDTRKYGGVASVLADRLKALRSKAA